jgi:hypothetical protein
MDKRLELHLLVVIRIDQKEGWETVILDESKYKVETGSNKLER